MDTEYRRIAHIVPSVRPEAQSGSDMPSQQQSSVKVKNAGRFFAFVMIFALAGAAGAHFLADKLPPLYSAVALIEVKTAFAPSLSPGAEGDRAQMLIAHIVADAHSDSVLQKQAEYKGAGFEFELAQALGQGLQVQPNDAALGVAVVATLTEPEKAIRLANEVAALLIERQAQRRAALWAEAETRASRAVTDLQQAAALSARAASDYRASHRAEPKTTDSTPDAAQNRALLRSRLEAAQARYAALKHATPDDPYVTGDITSGVLTYLRAQYAEQKQQLSKLSVVYGPQHPNLQHVQQNLHVLSQQITAELVRLASAAQAEVQDVQQQLRAQGDAAPPHDTGDSVPPEVRAEMERLDAQAALDKNLYEHARETQAILKQDSEMQSPVVALGEAAHNPVPVHRLALVHIVSLGAALGALIGAIFSGAFKTSASGPLKPSLGATQHNPTAQAVAEDVSMGPDYAVGLLPPPLPAPPRSNAAVLSVVDMRVPLQPFVLKLRSLKEAKGSCCVAVMALPGAKGRTSVAVALAHLAAQKGMSVLMISDHGQTQDIEPGLLDIVSRKTNPRELTHYDPLSDFMLMRSGCAVPEDIWELARHRNFTAVMQAITDSWDVVIVELPLMPVQNSPHTPLLPLDLLILTAHPAVQTAQEMDNARQRYAERCAVPVVVVANAYG